MTETMTRSIKNLGGRPTTGHDPAISLRMHPATVAAIDRLAVEKGMSRSELIREALAEYVKRQSRK